MQEQSIPQPGPGEVQLSIHNVGICGTDITLWKTGTLEHVDIEKPIVLGHESSGMITKVGQGVDQFQPGDRVAIEPALPCRLCDLCKMGRYNICLKLNILGIPQTNGNLVRFQVHPADYCFKIPDHVTSEEAALLEPLSVVVHACRRGCVSLGHNVLVCGAGPIGLLSMFTAKAMGAAKVIITDISEHRLKIAAELGADATVMVANKKPEKVAAQVAQLLGGQGPHVTIECSAAESAVQTAIYATRSGGVVVLVGLGKPDMTIPIVNAAVQEVDIRGAFAYANCYPAALDMVASGQVNVKPLITHRYKLEQALEAFETARTGAGGAIKVMINCKRSG